MVVDEPELHLHPSMARLWVSELVSECLKGGRHAVVVTHQPELIEPTTYEELSAVWSFAADRAPRKMTEPILEQQRPRVATSLARNPRLVSQLVFSPRPVLVEGPTDVAALSAATMRSRPTEAAAQTDFIKCGGISELALWWELSTELLPNVRGVADLDALFSTDVRRAVESRPGVAEDTGKLFKTSSTKTSEILRPILRKADEAGVAPHQKDRSRWLAQFGATVDPNLVDRRDTLLDIWRRHGLWLHPQGDLEAVLGLSPSDKHVETARDAASTPGPIDDVVAWAAYGLDTKSDILNLLNHEVEVIAHEIIEAQRLDAELRCDSPLGVRKKTYGRLVSVTPEGVAAHRITVKVPEEYVGYWVTFSRETPPLEIYLREPQDGTHAP